MSLKTDIFESRKYQGVESAHWHGRIVPMVLRGGPFDNAGRSRIDADKRLACVRPEHNEVRLPENCERRVVRIGDDGSHEIQAKNPETGEWVWQSRYATHYYERTADLEGDWEVWRYVEPDQ